MLSVTPRWRPTLDVILRRATPKTNHGRRVVDRGVAPETSRAALNEARTFSAPGNRDVPPEGSWSPDGRLTVEAVAINGRAVGVEFRLRTDLVSVGRVESATVSLFDRIELARWLSMALSGYPMVDLESDDARLSGDENNRVAVSLTAGGLGQAAVHAWELSPAEVRALAGRI